MKNKGVLRFSVKRGNMFTLGEKLVLVCLFLMSMDFYNRYIYLAFAATVFLIIQKRNFKFPTMLFPVFAFTMSICIFSPQARSLAGLVEPFVFPLCLLIGYNMTDSNSEDMESAVERIILVLALGAFAHFMGNMFFNWGVADQRSTTDIWTKASMAATRQAGLSCIIVGVAVAWLFSDKKKFAKIFAVIIIASVVYYNFTLATRTMMVQLAVAVIVAVVFGLLFESKTGTRMKIVLFSLIGGLLLLYVINTDWFASMFEDTVFFERFFGKNAYTELGDDNRTNLKLLYLEHMWGYPFGGLNIRSTWGVYAHDVLLDTYDEAGIFALVAVVVFLIDASVKLIKICRNHQISKNLRMVLLCVTTVVFLEFMVEPILEGLPWLLANFCLIYGTMGRLSCWDGRHKNNVAEENI